MIALDNTPARGDYVRYIDDLMKRAALAAPAVVSSDGDMASNVDALLRDRTGIATTGAANEWTPTAPSVSRRTRPPVPSTSSGFTTPTPAAAAAAAASAALANAASLLMSGQVGPRARLSATVVVALVAIVVGGVLILVGLLRQPFNLAIVVGGGALIAWALRRIKAAGIGAVRTRAT